MGAGVFGAGGVLASLKAQEESQQQQAEVPINGTPKQEEKREEPIISKPKRTPFIYRDWVS